jgi:SRSO17 transposase
LPREWTDDRERCRAAGIPEGVTFATKPELARRLVERALEAGARPAWVVADSVYGADSKLRFFLEAKGQPYVMAVTFAQSVWTGLSQRRVKSLVALAPADAWQRLKVGAGTKGPRLFDWAAVAINHPYEPRSWQRWVLLRRSCSEPEDITFYLAFGPAGTALPELARAAGRRWATSGGLCPRQRRSRPGSVRSTLLGRLAPAHDAGHGGPRALSPDARPAFCPRSVPAADAGGL